MKLINTIIKKLKIMYYENEIIDVEQSLEILEGKSHFGKFGAKLLALQFLSTEEKMREELISKREKLRKKLDEVKREK
jgi:hypothetical protein